MNLSVDPFANLDQKVPFGKITRSSAGSVFPQRAQGCVAMNPSNSGRFRERALAWESTAGEVGRAAERSGLETELRGPAALVACMPDYCSGVPESVGNPPFLRGCRHGLCRQRPEALRRHGRRQMCLLAADRRWNVVTAGSPAAPYPGSPTLSVRRIHPAWWWLLSVMVARLRR